MTLPNWNPDDYFVSFSDSHYKGPIAGMPIYNKVGMVMRFIIEDILREVKSCINCDAELAAIILCLVLVDYLAGYYTGHQSRRIDFIGFMHKYFPKKYSPYNEIIYDQLRSGLLHNLAAINPWKGHGKSFRIHSHLEKHLEEDFNEEGEWQINFSVKLFAEDIGRAWVMYAHDIIMKSEEQPNLAKNFHKRFNKLDGKGALMIKTND